MQTPDETPATWVMVLTGLLLPPAISLATIAAVIAAERTGGGRHLMTIIGAGVIVLLMIAIVGTAIAADMFDGSTSISIVGGVLLWWGYVIMIAMSAPAIGYFVSLPFLDGH